ncbi:PREDICTED: enhancer of split m7 protein [Rhagoletis zephyria]|uniref:enhancer of split m7 protein n=1 Tax=Rhagoletis zephyria TaxID=28612 RepID=UPI0008115A4D|nr:PREDICTED: enhancer of split m7 protein [Rhagoletis zephyria]
MATSAYELSKTYRYRKVMKPLLERKRRARINQCLDELKDLMAECVQQQSGEPEVKLEKADILELTVEHLRKMRQQQTCARSANEGARQSFRSGYIKAAHEISRCLATLPNVDVQLGTHLMTQLGLRLNQLESQLHEVRTAVNQPLNVNCGPATPPTTSASMYSPVSSGYASDNESTTSSHSAAHSSGLLQVSSTQLWRPW